VAVDAPAVADPSPVDAPVVRDTAPVDAAPPIVRQPLPVFASGTRVKIGQYRTADGFRTFRSLVDAQRNVDCRLWNAADNKVRCLPDSAISQLMYSDPNCTDPVVEVPRSGCRDRTTIMLFAPNTCPTGYKVHQIGPDALALATVYRRSGTTCAAQATLPDVFEYRRLGAEVSASTFPEITRSPADVSPSLRVVYARTADGAQWPLLHQDRAGNFDCAFVETTEGWRCLPDRPVFAPVGTYFADAACTSAAGSGNPPPCASDRYASRSEGRTCTQPARYTVNEVTRIGAYYLRTAQGCARQEADNYYAVGAEVPVTRFVQATEEPPVPGTRLVHKRIAHGTLASETEVFDTRLQVACQPGTTIDGKLRCVPKQAASVGAFFSDAQCTVRAALAACAPYAIEQGAAAGCPEPGRRIYELGPRLDTVYQRVSPSNCRVVSPSGAYHRVGAEVPPETFEALEPHSL
jgi:hypothetical protein